MKPFEKIDLSDIDRFKSICGEDKVLFDRDSMEPYASDETEDLVFFPEVVLKPSNVDEISAILKYCNDNNIPVTLRGAGTGLSGGALPVCQGVILSMEHLNKIINIDERNLQATVEPAVITEVLQEAVKDKGLFYPPDPASRGSCFIGGNIAESSGGAKAVKYGTTKDYVLNLQVVLPDGSVFWTGANVLKNVTGYNLTQLIIGSEGTLAVVTKIVLRLIPLPRLSLVMLVPFYNEVDACEAVSSIFHTGITPSSLEFMERDAIEWGLKYIEDINLIIEPNVKAHLLIEVDGNDKDQLFKECETIYKTLETFNTGEILLAEASHQKESLLRLRSKIGEAVKSNSVYKEEDTVVPRAELPSLIKTIKEIGAKYNFRSICYGHAGDGNLHVNIVRDQLNDYDWNIKVPKGIREIFKYCVSLGGTISGEHGIGYTQKDYLPIALSNTQIELMKKIKNAFDPNGILNPSKIFPEV